jgi:hypothetical protein
MRETRSAARTSAGSEVSLYAGIFAGAAVGDDAGTVFVRITAGFFGAGFLRAAAGRFRAAGFLTGFLAGFLAGDFFGAARFRAGFFVTFLFGEGRLRAAAGRFLAACFFTGFRGDSFFFSGFFADCFLEGFRVLTASSSCAGGCAPRLRV